MSRIKSVLFRLCLISLINLNFLFLICCDNAKAENMVAPFSVTYIDVGQGDATLIKLPDGKIVLIDTGAGTDENYHKVVNALSDINEEKIDCLILTHPDSEHIGNGLRLIDNLSVSMVYLPDVANVELFPIFKEIKDRLIEKGIKYRISALGENLSDKDYTFRFLAPYPSIIDGSLYTEFNLTEQPTGEQINNVSAVVYVEYKGVRFLFSGDAEEKAEQKFIEDVKAYVFGSEVTLSDIHFLKVGGHGSKNCCCQTLLSYVKPQNAVISSGDSFSGHPATETLVRIMEANEKCKIYRTDVCGDIRVGINEQGEYKITNQIK